MKNNFYDFFIKCLFFAAFSSVNLCGMDLAQQQNELQPNENEKRELIKKYQVIQTIDLGEIIYKMVDLGNESFAIKYNENIGIYTKAEDKYKETQIINLEDNIGDIVSLGDESFAIRANDRKIEIYTKPGNTYEKTQIIHLEKIISNIINLGN